MADDIENGAVLIPLLGTISFNQAVESVGKAAMLRFISP